MRKTVETLVVALLASMTCLVAQAKGPGNRLGQASYYVGEFEKEVAREKGGAKAGWYTVKEIPADVTPERLFYNFGEFGHWCYLDGEMRASFESALTVLSRYNTTTKESNLEGLLKALDEMGKAWSVVTDTRIKALAEARKGRSTASFAALIEMDETVMDRMELAMSEFRENIKWFQKDGTVAFKLRTGLPCVHLFTYTDVSTDRPEGPDNHLLFEKAAAYLAKTFNDGYSSKWRHNIRKK